MEDTIFILYGNLMGTETFIRVCLRHGRTVTLDSCHMTNRGKNIRIIMRNFIKLRAEKYSIYLSVRKMESSTCHVVMNYGCF